MKKQNEETEKYPNNGIGDLCKRMDESQAETDELMLDHEERMILLEVGE